MLVNINHGGQGVLISSTANAYSVNILTMADFKLSACHLIEIWEERHQTVSLKLARDGSIPPSHLFSCSLLSDEEC
jgi:hypothetical protein